MGLCKAEKCQPKPVESDLCTVPKFWAEFTCLVMKFREFPAQKAGRVSYRYKGLVAAV